MEFKGKTAVVTGSSSGIGKDILAAASQIGALRWSWVVKTR